MFRLKICGLWQEFTCARCLAEATGHGCLPYVCEKSGGKVYFCSEVCKAAAGQGEFSKLHRSLAKKEEVSDPVGIDQILLTSLTALQLRTEHDELVESLTTAGAFASSCFASSAI